MGLKTNFLYLEYNQQKCIKFPRRFVKELFDFLFWRPEDNSHCMVNRQMNFAHAHFKNSWSVCPIWIFENNVINPFDLLSKISLELFSVSGIHIALGILILESLPPLNVPLLLHDLRELGPVLKSSHIPVQCSVPLSRH